VFIASLNVSLISVLGVAPLVPALGVMLTILGATMSTQLLLRQPSPPVQSPSLQHAASAMQPVPQALVPSAQAQLLLALQTLSPEQPSSSQQPVEGKHLSPQRMKLVAQVKSQLVPSHVALAFAGAVQGVHDEPHAKVLVRWMQTPLQSWLPMGHSASHGEALAMHAPAHNFLPEGQLVVHSLFSQPASPPLGAGHASQRPPHVSGASSTTHSSPHWCASSSHSQAPLAQ
jgi:hypothetical protein